mmetsp:Transcript_82159/g.255103  ORF Transcript_82159/g.255103 Transcript_82159/m.255103 type:complete len:204 (+) Transcript_82159:1-612(+)
MAAAKPTMTRRQTELTVDPERLERRHSSNRRRAITLDAFTAEQIAECKDLFDVFDRSGDGCIDRGEFGPMMRTLGLNLTERELDMFFSRMDTTEDGKIEFGELIEFLQKIARPISLEEEMLEAFRFFTPGDEVADQASSLVTKQELAKVLGDMGEDVTEAECGDMITAATGGLDYVDFQTFQRICKASKSAPHHPCGEENVAA